MVHDMYLCGLYGPTLVAIIESLMPLYPFGSSYKEVYGSGPGTDQGHMVCERAVALCCGAIAHPAGQQFVAKEVAPAVVRHFPRFKARSSSIVPGGQMQDAEYLEDQRLRGEEADMTVGGRWRLLGGMCGSGRIQSCSLHLLCPPAPLDRLSPLGGGMMHTRRRHVRVVR